ncbi:16676_t:CDS:1, partial [Funneliformis geosporum]
RIISYLRNEYQSIKESEEFITNTTRISDNYDSNLLESNNSLLIDIFAKSQNTENKINEYLSLPQ